ncbi:unnamed protein product [Amoebophrya sp. A120]|nr:unnamed protein product [Amoebophrya sp. A120]|eukprot:GSA120T00024045001.1
MARKAQVVDAQKLALMAHAGHVSGEALTDDENEELALRSMETKYSYTTSGSRTESQIERLRHTTTVYDGEVDGAGPLLAPGGSDVEEPFFWLPSAQVELEGRESEGMGKAFARPGRPGLPFSRPSMPKPASSPASRKSKGKKGKMPRNSDAPEIISARGRRGPLQMPQMRASSDGEISSPRRMAPAPKAAPTSRKSLQAARASRASSYPTRTGTAAEGSGTAAMGSGTTTEGSGTGTDRWRATGGGSTATEDDGRFTRGYTRAWADDREALLDDRQHPFLHGLLQAAQLHQRASGSVPDNEPQKVSVTIRDEKGDILADVTGDAADWLSMRKILADGSAPGAVRISEEMDAGTRSSPTAVRFSDDAVGTRDATSNRAAQKSRKRTTAARRAAYQRSLHSQKKTIAEMEKEIDLLKHDMEDEMVILQKEQDDDRAILLKKRPEIKLTDSLKKVLTHPFEVVRDMLEDIGCVKPKQGEAKPLIQTEPASTEDPSPPPGAGADAPPGSRSTPGGAPGTLGVVPSSARAEVPQGGGAGGPSSARLLPPGAGPSSARPLPPAALPSSARALQFLQYSVNLLERHKSSSRAASPTVPGTTTSAGDDDIPSREEEPLASPRPAKAPQPPPTSASQLEMIKARMKQQRVATKETLAAKPKSRTHLQGSFSLATHQSSSSSSGALNNGSTNFASAAAASAASDDFVPSTDVGFSNVPTPERTAFEEKGENAGSSTKVEQAAVARQDEEEVYETTQEKADQQSGKNPTSARRRDLEFENDDRMPGVLGKSPATPAPAGRTGIDLGSNVEQEPAISPDPGSEKDFLRSSATIRLSETAMQEAAPPAPRVTLKELQNYMRKSSGDDGAISEQDQDDNLVLPKVKSTAIRRIRDKKSRQIGSR